MALTALEWQTTFNAVKDAISLLDAEGKILLCNNAMLELTGRSIEDVTGKPCWSIIHGTKAPIENCPFVRMRASLQRETLVMRMGHRVFDVRTDPILSEQRTLTGAVHTLSDITERTRTEEALRNSEARFRTVAEACGDAIFITDGEKIIFWNTAAAELFGYTKDEILGSEASILLPESLRPVNREAQERFMRTGVFIHGSRPIETVCRKKDGSEAPIEATTSGWKIDENYYFSCIVRDISGRRRIEDERERLIDELREAIASIKTLSGLLPICSSCKKIRDDRGYWNMLETYISRHSMAEFTHSICPDCARRLYPDMFEKK